MWLVNFFETYGHMISTTALVITMGVIIWYALETRKLRKETVKQTELSQRPFVMIFDSKMLGIRYKNSGQGIALNIEIMPYEYEDYRVAFKKETILNAKEKSTFTLYPIVTKTKTGKILASEAINFTPNQLRRFNSDIVHNLDIRYENIEKKRYQTRVQISREGIKFVDTKEV